MQKRTLRKIRTRPEQTHWVYDSEEEFKEKYNECYGVGDIPEVIKNWRNGKQGDWVSTDDGYILQILKWGTIKHPSDTEKRQYAKGWVRTIVGSFVIAPNTYMDGVVDGRDRYRFSKRQKSEIEKNLNNRLGFSNKESELYSMISRGDDPTEAYAKVHGLTDMDKAKYRVGVLLKKKRWINRFSEMFRMRAIENNLDEQWVIDQLKAIGEQDSDWRARLGAVKEVKSIHEASGGEEEESMTYFKGFSEGEFEEIEQGFGEDIEVERIDEG